MNVTSKITVDLTRQNVGQRVNAVQGDGNTRLVEITLLSGGAPWTPPEGVEAAIAYMQPGGTKGLYNKLADGTAAISISGNVATVILAPQMLTASGTVQASLVFNDQQLNRLTTFPFSVSVTSNPAAGAQKVEDYLRLQWLEDKLDEYLHKAADSGAFDGKTGDNGVTFTPTVSENGDISWRNNGGLPNPQTVNIQGPQGDSTAATAAANAAQTSAANAETHAADAAASAAAAQEAVGAMGTELSQIKDDLADLDSMLLDKSSNLFNQDFNETVDRIAYVNGIANNYTLNGNGEISEQSGKTISYLIPIEGGKTYYTYRVNGSGVFVKSGVAYYKLFDANMAPIPGGGCVQSFTAPENARYVRFRADEPSYQCFGINVKTTLSTDDTLTEYEEYYETRPVIDKSAIRHLENNVSSLSGKVANLEHNILVNNSKYQEFSALFNDTDNAEAFLFYTDPHLMGTNGAYDYARMKKYVEVLKEAQESVSLNYVLCGGDWLNSGDTKQQACYKLGVVGGITSVNLKNHHMIAGNHDTGYQGANWAIDNSKYKDDILSDNTIKNLLFRDEGNLYYKFKGANSTTFVINTGIEWWDWLTADRIVQLQWLHDELLADNSEHKVIALHAVAGSNPDEKYIFAQSVGRIIEAFNSRGIADVSGWGGSTYDFSNAVGKIDYAICGHSHADFVTTLGGVPCIGTSNMTKGETPTFDLVLVDYDDFVINLVRIGTGSNRTVNLT